MAKTAKPDASAARKAVAPPAANLSAAEALCAVASQCILADASVTAEEQDSLRQYLARLPVLRRGGAKATDAMLAKVNRIAREQGDDALLRSAAAALPPNLRGTAFFVAADLLLADRDLAPAEEDLLMTMRETLGVDPKEAGRIIEVVRIKNQS